MDYTKPVDHSICINYFKADSIFWLWLPITFKVVNAPLNISKFAWLSSKIETSLPSLPSILSCPALPVNKSIPILPINVSLPFVPVYSVFETCLLKSRFFRPSASWDKLSKAIEIEPF